MGQSIITHKLKVGGFKAYMNACGIVFDSYSGGRALMRFLSRKSPNKVKFPDIWIVNLSFQKQTLNIPSPIFLYHFFMLNFREPTPTPTSNKLKTPPFFNPTNVNRLQEEVGVPILTNKQSVYGLFLDELIQHYKSMPFELDFTFLKSMRKIHSKGNELGTKEYLQKAALILIEAKNKVIKEQIQQYILECQQFLLRCPNALTNRRKHTKKPKKRICSLSPKRMESRSEFKKIIPQQKFFERVKSEGKQQNLYHSQHQKRSSFLLHPKSIHFECSNDFLKKVKKQKQKQECGLPKISQSNRMLQDNIRSSMLKNKHIRVFFSPINRSLAAHYEKGHMLRNILFSSKRTTSNTSSLQKVQQKMRSQKRQKNQVNIELDLPKREEEPRKNRKLMLQLLREKNKQAFLNE